MHFYAVYSHHETGQILVKNLSNDKKILDKLKFVKLTIQTSQTDKSWPVFDDPTTRKILCVSRYLAYGQILSHMQNTESSRFSKDMGRLWYQ